MQQKGTVTAHKMFEKDDPGCGWGTNEGRIAVFPMTYSNCKTENGKITIYVSEGEFTSDMIEKEFFGLRRRRKNRRLAEQADKAGARRI